MLRSNRLALIFGCLSFGTFAAHYALEWAGWGKMPHRVALDFAPVHDVGELGPGREEADVGVSFKNSSPHPLKFVGAENHCGRVVCLGALTLPIELAPRSEQTVSFKVA